MSEGHVIIYRYVPGLFRWGYSLAEEREDLFEEDSFAYKLMAAGADKLYDYITENDYDTVICPHVFSAIMLTEVLREHNCQVRSCFVATDYTISPGALDSKLDLYFVPDYSVMEGHEEQVDMDSVVASGIPVRSCFFQKQAISQAKKALNIPENAQHLLVMCGSMGCGPIRKLGEQIAQGLNDNQYMTVVCGTNHSLESHLSDAFQGRENLRVLGYCDDISLLMDSADLYLTKPGGISVSEALVKALPMVLIDSVSGCEKYNLEYFTQLGLAASAADTEDTARLCLDILNDKARLKSMHQAGLSHPRYNGAELIYEYISNVSVSAEERIAK